MGSRHPLPPGPQGTRKQPVQVMSDVLKGSIYEMAIDDPLAGICALEAVSDYAHLVATTIQSELLAHTWDSISSKLLLIKDEIEKALANEKHGKNLL